MSDGLTGISQRECIVSSYDIISNEREIHLHLYNRYYNERDTLYERYKIVASEKNILPQRELIYDSRNILISSYDILNSDISLFFERSYEIYSNDRDIDLKFWYSLYNYRNINITFTSYDNKGAITTSFYSSIRNILLKVWHTTERTCLTKGISFITHGSNRFAYMSLTSSPFSQKNICFEFSHLHYTFIINPLEHDLFNSVVADDDLGLLFENKQVPNDVLTFSFYDVEDKFRNVDFPLFIWNSNNNKYDEYVISKKGVHRIKLFQYGSTNTYFVDGFFVPIHSLLYMYFLPVDVLSKKPSNDLNNRIKDAYEHGYLKIMLDNKEYEFGKKMVFNNYEYKKVAFKFFIYPEYFNNNFMLMLKYSYPYVGNVYRSFLYFYKEI